MKSNICIVLIPIHKARHISLVMGVYFGFVPRRKCVTTLNKATFNSVNSGGKYFILCFVTHTKRKHIAAVLITGLVQWPFMAKGKQNLHTVLRAVIKGQARSVHAR